MHPGGEMEKPFNPIGSLIWHRNKISMLVLVTFVALLPVIKWQYKVYFEAESKIRIEPVIVVGSSDKEDSITNRYDSFVNTEIIKIQSPDTVSRAWDQLSNEYRLKLMPSGYSDTKVIKKLIHKIKVERIHGAHMIKIVVTDQQPEGLKEVADSIVQVYLEDIQNKIKNKSYLELKQLEKERDLLTHKIETEMGKKRKFAKKAGISTFSEQFNPLNRQLSDLQEAFTRAYGARVEKENILGGVLKEIVDLKQIPLDSLVDEMVEKDQSLWDLGFWTYQTLQEMRASLDGITSDNPDRKYVEGRMKNLKDHLERLRGEVRERANKVIHSKRDYELKKRLIHSKFQFEASKKTEGELRMEMKRVKIQSTKVSANILLGQETDKSLVMLNNLYIETNKKIQNQLSVMQTPGRVFLENYAQVPTEPLRSNLKKLIIVALLLSFGWPVIMALLYDLLDNRIRSTTDLEAALGFSPTWPIAHLRDGDFANVVSEAPESVLSKAIRSLAVRLNNERVKHQAKFVVFTSVDPRSGVSEIVLNSAYAMRKMCKRVLVLELNFLTPSIVRTLHIPGSIRGLAGILEQKRFAMNSVFHDKKRDVDVLPLVGDVKISNANIEKMLDVISGLYDFIFIDTASVLQSDLTEFLILKADTGVLVVNGDRTLYRNVRHAVDIINKLEIPSLAVVLNWLSLKKLQKGTVEK